MDRNVPGKNGDTIMRLMSVCLNLSEKEDSRESQYKPIAFDHCHS